jgi:hypothetical protein
MSGERDLAVLLSTMEPELQPGRYIFTTTRRIPETVGFLAVDGRASLSGEGSGYGTTKVAFTPLSGAPLNVR